MKEGWICPRCGRVNALFIAYCDCKVMINKCNHQWVVTGLSSNCTQYTCIKCGKTKSEYYGVPMYR